MPVNPDGDPTHWLTCILVDPAAAGVDREKVRLRLEDADVESRPLWKPLHLQPALTSARIVGGSVAEKLFDKGLCLPSGTSLSPRDLERVATAISETMP